MKQSEKERLRLQKELDSVSHKHELLERMNADVQKTVKALQAEVAEHKNRIEILTQELNIQKLQKPAIGRSSVGHKP